MSATGTEKTDAPRTVLVHLNCEIAEGTWSDLLDGLYDAYVRDNAEEPTGLPFMDRDEWERAEGSAIAAEALGDEIMGALSVGNDAENTPILWEATTCVAMAEAI